MAALIAVTVGGFALISITPIGRAIARRIGGSTDKESNTLRADVEQLKGELDNVHARLAELDDVQTRLDFAERLLAQQKVKDALPPGRI